MGFLRRLRFYLIGVGLGILMVMAIFKDRNLTSWTPRNQIKQDIETKTFSSNDQLNCILKCTQMDTLILKELINSGKVDFSKSDVQDKSKRIYHIDLNEYGIQSVEVQISDDLEMVSVKSKDPCDCNSMPD